MLGAESIFSRAAAATTPVVKTGPMVKGAEATRVAEMAKEFEATLLSLLLKEMRQTLEPEGLFPGDQGDVQGGLFDLYMGRHLAESGGVGLASALVRQMDPGAYPKREPFPHDATRSTGPVSLSPAPLA